MRVDWQYSILNASVNKFRLPILNLNTILCREETDQSDQAEASDKGAKPGNAVTRLQKVLSVDIEINNSTSAHSAILQAAQLASDRPNIVDLPKWLCMPNKYAQNWIFYSMLGLGALYGGVFIVR